MKNYKVTYTDGVMEKTAVKEGLQAARHFASRLWIGIPTVSIVSITSLETGKEVKVAAKYKKSLLNRDNAHYQVIVVDAYGNENYHGCVGIDSVYEIAMEAKVEGRYLEVVKFSTGTFEDYTELLNESLYEQPAEAPQELTYEITLTDGHTQAVKTANDLCEVEAICDDCWRTMLGVTVEKIVEQLTGKELTIPDRFRQPMLTEKAVIDVTYTDGETVGSVSVQGLGELYDWLITELDIRCWLETVKVEGESYQLVDEGLIYPRETYLLTTESQLGGTRQEIYYSVQELEERIKEVHSHGNYISRIVMKWPDEEIELNPCAFDEHKVAPVEHFVLNYKLDGKRHYGDYEVYEDMVAAYRRLDAKGIDVMCYQNVPIGEDIDSFVSWERYPEWRVNAKGRKI